MLQFLRRPRCNDFELRTVHQKQFLISLICAAVRRRTQIEGSFENLEILTSLGNRNGSSTSGGPPTCHTARYPSDLCRELAALILQSFITSGGRPQRLVPVENIPMFFGRAEWTSTGRHTRRAAKRQCPIFPFVPDPGVPSSLTPLLEHDSYEGMG